MSLLARKLGRLLSGGYTPLQVLQRLNRTPARHAVKALMTLTDLHGKRRRLAYARSIPAQPGAAELREAGFCRPRIDQALLAELSRTSLALLAAVGEEHRRANKGYLKALIAEALKGGRIDNSSIFVRFAIQPGVVDPVAKYFGEAPYLSYVALDLSEHTHEPLSTSQLWHRDYDDTKVVKLFAYLTDVRDEADGPFTYIPPRPSRQVGGAMARAHLHDETVFRHVPQTVVQRVRGAAGEAFLVDTGRCYHMGSRVAPEHTRLMFTACYLTRPAIYPNFLNTIAISSALTAREALLLEP